MVMYRTLWGRRGNDKFLVTLLTQCEIAKFQKWFNSTVQLAQPFWYNLIII